MVRAARRCVFLLAAVFALFAAPPAGAQEGSAAETAAAREQFKAGVEAAKAARWEEARQAFARAYELSPQPITLYNLAGAQGQTHRLVAALESYRRFLREGTTGAAAKYRDAAQEAIADLEKRVGHVKIVVEGIETSDRVELDGKALSHAALGVDVPVDPGDHAVTVLRADTVVARKAFQLSEGQSTSVSMNAASKGPAPAPPAASATAAKPEPSATAAPAPKGVLAPSEPAPAPKQKSSGGLLDSPWFWTAVGVVVVGGAAVAWYATREPAAAPPAYAGNFGPGTVTVR